MKALIDSKINKQQKVTVNNGLVNLFAISITLLLVIRDIGGVSINKYIYVAVCILFMTISSFENICYMICFLIPLFNGLPGTYIRLAAVLLLIAKQKWKIHGNVFGIIVFFSLLEVLASFWYPYSDAIQIVSYIATLFILVFFISCSELFNRERCIEFFVLGSVVFCFIVIVSGIMSSRTNWLDMVSNVQLRFGESEEEGMHISANANALGYYCVAGCFSAFYLARRAVSPMLNKTIYMVISTFIAIVGFLSLSRSYVIVFLLICLLYVLIIGSNYRRVLGILVSTIVVLLIVYWLIGHNSIASSIWNGLVIRFNRYDVVGGNGRAEAFAMFNKAFVGNIRFVILGTGVTQYKNVIGVSGSIHNMLQQIIICYGLFGASVFLTIIFRPVVKFLKANNKSMAALLPLLSIILVAQTIQFIYPFQYMPVYAMGFLILQESVSRGMNE